MVGSSSEDENSCTQASTMPPKDPTASLISTLRALADQLETKTEHLTEVVHEAIPDSARITTVDADLQRLLKGLKGRGRV